MLPLQAWNTLIHSILLHIEEVITKEARFCLATTVLVGSNPQPPPWRSCNDWKTRQREALRAASLSKMAAQKAQMWLLLYF